MTSTTLDSIHAPTLPPLEQRSLLARISFWACGGIYSLLALWTFLEFEPATLESQSALIVLALAISGLLLAIGAMLITVVSVVLFGMYWHRLVRHATAKGVSLSSPAWEVAKCFIPVLWWANPFATARKVLFGTERTSVVGLWQVFYLAANFASIFGQRLEHSGLRAVSLLSFSLAAFFGAKVISDLTVAVKERASL